MAFVYFNPNPTGQFVGDCVIRGISKIMGQGWEETYLKICAQGLLMHDMPSSNRVWGRYLYNSGFRRSLLPDTCPNQRTCSFFCLERR